MEKKHNIIYRNLLILILLVILFFTVNKYIFKKDHFTEGKETHECYGRRNGFPCKKTDHYCMNGDTENPSCQHKTLEELLNLKKPKASLCRRADIDNNQEYKKWVNNYTDRLDTDLSCSTSKDGNCSNKKFRERCPATCYACSRNNYDSYSVKIDPYIGN